MINTMLVILCLIFFFTSLSEGKLYQVLSMSRHGARYAMNPYYDGDFFKQLKGELTSVGMKQHQSLGKMLRKDYIQHLGFLSEQYKDGQIDVFSTDVNRTFQSIRSQLYGLYGLGTGQKLVQVDKSYHLPPYSFNNDSSDTLFSLPQGYQEIPILVDSNIVLTTCTNFQRDLARNVKRQSETYNEMNMTYYPFIKRMAQVFNVSMDKMDFQAISSIYDTLTVDKSLGRPMPENNFTQDDYLNLRHLHYWYNFLKMNSNISNTLSTGKLKKVLKQFDDRIANVNKTLKWTFLSCHDTDATCMLMNLNISTAQCIQQKYRKGSTSALNCDPNQEYATNIIIELHSDDQGSTFYVQIRHDGRYVYLCQKKSIKCDYKQWKQRVISNIIVDVEKICEGP